MTVHQFWSQKTIELWKCINFNESVKLSLVETTEVVKFVIMERKHFKREFWAENMYVLWEQKDAVNMYVLITNRTGRELKLKERYEITQ